MTNSRQPSFEILARPSENFGERILSRKSKSLEWEVRENSTVREDRRPAIVSVWTKKSVSYLKNEVSFDLLNQGV